MGLQLVSATQAQCMACGQSLRCSTQGLLGRALEINICERKGHTRGWAVSVEAQLALQEVLRTGGPLGLSQVEAIGLGL